MHCAIMGSIERFTAVLFEHTGGNFPLWLAPEQVRIVPVSEKHHEYATKVYQALKAIGIRASLDDSNESMGKKIRGAKKDKLPYFVVVGDTEVTNKTVTLERRDGTTSTLSHSALSDHLLTEIEAKV